MKANVTTLVGFLSMLMTQLELTTAASAHRTKSSIATTTENLPASIWHSVVVDWQAVCEELCGANLGGPACGSEQCLSIKEAANNTYKELLHGTELIVCPVLCERDLGEDRCACDTYVTSSRRRRSVSTDMDAVCRSFCERGLTLLNGCTPCVKAFTEAAIVVTTPQSEATTVATPTTVSIDTTTPDWDLLCVELCRIGEGGALCKCDLVPFF